MIIQQLFTGRMRPRHIRFIDVFKLSARRVGHYSSVSRPSLMDRVSINSKVFFNGIRTCNGSKIAGPALVHQALINKPIFPYSVEFDVPLAVFGYNNLRSSLFRGKAVDCLMDPHLKKIVVFSEWAKRSFRLYFGTDVASKVQVVYPSVGKNLQIDHSWETRQYDFIFVSTQFRIKSGVQVVQAFRSLRSRTGQKLKLCVVSNLQEVYSCIGSFDKYEGVDFVESKISHEAVLEYLCNSKILVHPSLMESFGVVVLEGLNSGCGVISTGIASFPEMVFDGVNGVRLDPPLSALSGDYFVPELSSAQDFSELLSSFCLDEWTDQIGTAMASVIESKRVLNFGKASKAIFNERFSDQKVVDSLVPVLRSMVGD